MPSPSVAMKRNVQIYPWRSFFYNLTFWQATWFLFFQNTLSAAQALLLYVVYDITVTVLEVPSGYMSDRIGRRITLICAAGTSLVGMGLLFFGGAFWVFVLGMMMLGMGAALNSGTDTALLYQSLAALGRADEMEAQSVKAWRFTFVALAFSAVIGGGAATVYPALPFGLTGLAFGISLVLTMRLSEPETTRSSQNEWQRIKGVVAQLKRPALAWLFGISVLMYGFSHIPFVFGQPFIAETLAQSGISSDAPLVSGSVTALMMGISVLVSLIAPRLRMRFGITTLLLVAFGLQIGLAAALSIFGSVFAIALLLLRMVPDSLSTPFIQAHLQPLLGDENRATFVSLKSFMGRLLFAGSLTLAAGSTSNLDVMPLGDIQTILAIYAGFGMICLMGFAVMARRLG